MITIRKTDERGHANHGWLDSRFSFSFAEYDDPSHVHFGPLRVLNEDWVEPGTGFPPHPHRDMEIITIVLDGAVAHQDSTGGEGLTRPGEVQVMTAGTGVSHSEYNPSDSDRLHMLQIWILPDARGHTPRYAQKAFGTAARHNALLPVVSVDGNNGTLPIHQDATLYVSELDAGARLEHVLAPGRRGYLFLSKGAALINGQRLDVGDAALITDEPRLTLTGAAPADLVLMDLP
jgi:redox-sensitive bicupin YhaK (pirin superfamily)